MRPSTGASPFLQKSTLQQFISIDSKQSAQRERPKTLFAHLSEAILLPRPSQLHSSWLTAQCRLPKRTEEPNACEHSDGEVDTATSNGEKSSGGMGGGHCAQWRMLWIRLKPSPSADVTGVSPILVQMRKAHAQFVQMWAGATRSTAHQTRRMTCSLHVSFPRWPCRRSPGRTC